MNKKGEGDKIFATFPMPFFILYYVMISCPILQQQ